MTNEAVNQLITRLRDWSFSQTADYVKKSVDDGQTNHLKKVLVGSVRCLGTPETFDNKSPDILTHFKLGLGIGILIAAQKTEEAQISICSETFERLILDDDTDGPLDARSKKLLLTELCYMDQFVSGKTRQHINDRFSHILRENAWSPAIRDYLHAWAQLEQSRELKEMLPVERLEAPRLILVLSAKGGTGKSITAAAIAKFLIGKGKHVGVIDLDDSGPSAQYLFDVPQVSEAMKEIPPAVCNSDDRWCYPTFLDVLHHVNECSQHTRSSILSVASKAVLTSPTEPKLAFVLLPESPTFCADVARAWSQGEARNIIKAFDGCIRAMSKIGCDYVVVDFSPGVYGTNGRIIKWASMHYASTPIVMTSSRASDIATSIYEAPWLAAKYEFDWATPLLHFVNRWDYEESCVRRIVAWANEATVAAVNAEIREGRAVSSATEIHSKRFWPIMYQQALDCDPANKVAAFDATQALTELPEDAGVSALSSLSADTSRNADFAIPFSSLEKTGWYKVLSSRLEEYLFPGTKICR